MRTRYLLIGAGVLISPIALVVGTALVVFTCVVVPALAIAVLVELWWIVFHLTP